MSRLSPLDPAAMTDAQRTMRDEILTGARGSLSGPFDAWLRSPGLGLHAQRLGAYLRFDSALPPELSELAILCVARHWRSEFEWFAHAEAAREAGVAEAVIIAIFEQREPDLSEPRAKIVYGVAQEMLQSRTLSTATHDRAHAALGEQGLVDLVGILGYYCLVSLTLNAFDVARPDGERLFRPTG